MTPSEILAALRAAGFSCRVAEGKLKLSPFSKLADHPALREAVITHREALVAHLEDEADWAARADALAALPTPFDGYTMPALLIRLHRDDEPPKYVAVDQRWLDDVKEYARVCKQQVEVKRERADKRQKARVRHDARQLLGEHP